MSLVKLKGRSRLYEIFPQLISVSRGFDKADLIIKNITLIDVNTGNFLDNYSIAVKGDHIAYIGRRCEDKVGSNTVVVDGEGRYASPGFMDGHIHIESSMLTLRGFTKLVLPRGVTTVFIDPHEIANVFGVNGVKLMIDESQNLPLKVFITFPSCVPSSPDLETTGGRLTPDDIKKAMEWDEVIALGEMMDFPGVLNLDDRVIREIAYTLEAGKIVEGHAPSLSYDDLVAYNAAAITSCHESRYGDEAYYKLLLGMHVMLRESSVSKNLHDTLSYLLGLGVDLRHVVLVTDDRDAKDLRDEGGVDFVVRRAIEEGVDPVEAIRMATLNVAEHYELARELGSLSPGRFADIILFDDLKNIDVNLVISDGKVIAKNGKLLSPISHFTYPNYILNSVNFKSNISANDLVFKTEIETGVAKVRIMDIERGPLIYEGVAELKIKNHFINPDVANDILHVAVVERYGKNGNIGKGFIKGFGFKKGASASSVAHDSHNIVVVGVDKEDMVFAVNKLREAGGGIIVVYNKKVLGFIHLPVAGLMSDKDPDIVIKQIEDTKEAYKKINTKLSSPHMKLSSLALAVIPEVRLTDKGLVNVRDVKIIDTILNISEN